MKVTALWRHPIKAHGREPLQHVMLTAGETIPYDRLWAIAHDAATTTVGEWVSCQNFSRGAKSPALMAITAELDEASETITLRHPDAEDLVVRPDVAPDALVSWVRPFVDQSRAQPMRVFRLEGRGFTDSPFPSISLCNHASHAAVEALSGSRLQRERWRGNIWFEGAPEWTEFDWLGHELKLGSARLHVKERVTRCLATTVNTDTGVRDVDTLKALNTQGHQDFGVYATVIQSGEVAVGDTLELL
ncbi:MAG: MOSC domain-containing protein [Sulfitobacter sp.]